jgi:predicted ABC-type exoprotein transport system permease subunit
MLLPSLLVLTFVGGMLMQWHVSQVNNYWALGVASMSWVLWVCVMCWAGIRELNRARLVPEWVESTEEEW